MFENLNNTARVLAATVAGGDYNAEHGNMAAVKATKSPPPQKSYYKSIYIMWLLSLKMFLFLFLFFFVEILVTNSHIFEPALNSLFFLLNMT